MVARETIEHRLERTAEGRRGSGRTAAAPAIDAALEPARRPEPIGAANV
jgi:hypothetical protein